MRKLLRKARKVLSYVLFCLLDHSIWISIQMTPGHVLIGIAKQRPWKSRRLQLSATRQRIWQGRIIWVLQRRCRRASWGSTCLSRSLSGRLLLDLIGVANELKLGMNKFPDGHKVPHAWLVDPQTSRPYTPGITPGAGVSLIQI